MSPPRIEKRLICISGFRQHHGSPNGIESLWMKLRKHESPTTRVSYVEWSTDWSRFAEHMMRTGMEDYGELDVRVFAYSWGAGHGFRSLAVELGNRGIDISSAVLSDGVYHSWRAIWRAMWSPFWTPRIVVPKNVKKVWWFRQFEDKPAGHNLVAECSGSTTIHDPKVLTVTHAYMDEAPEFHRRCLMSASTAR